MTVDLRWAPQRQVNFAVIISAITIVVCLLLAFVPRRRRRASGEETDPDLTVDSASDHGAGRGSVDVVERPVVDDQPELITAFDSNEDQTTVRRALVIAALIGLAAAIISPPFTGIVIAVATFVVLRVPRLRLALGLIAAGLVLATSVYIMIRQGRDSDLPNGGWPGSFGLSTDLVWAAVMFLMADAVIEVIQRRSAAKRRRAGTVPGAEPADHTDGSGAMTGRPGG
jgi:hypothetical protein